MAMLRCGMCGQRADADLMTFDKAKQVNLCTACRSRTKTEPRVKSQLIKRAIKADEENPAEEKTKYKCESCGYLFSRGTSHDGKVCPYCGKRGTVRIRGDIGAEDI